MAGFADRVEDRSTTTGTGAMTLAATPPTGYRTFSAAFSTGSPVWYCIEAIDGSGNATGDWETGQGTLTGATTLARSVLNSSSTGAFVNFAAGTKRVFCTVSGAYMNDTETHGRIEMKRFGATL
jgi:hypothetical protein